MTAEEPLLLRDIVDRPDEDLPRLRYAGWLETQGRSPYAEFIRLQLDLAQAPPCGHPATEPGCRVCAGREREGELLTAHGAEWLAPALPGEGWTPQRALGWLPAHECRSGTRLAAFHRGLVEALFLFLEDFLACEQWLASALLPLRRIQLTDRRPRATPDGGHDWSCNPEDSGAPFHLPETLSGCLALAPRGPGGWPSEEESLLALSRACVAYLRDYRTRQARTQVFTAADVARLVRVAPTTVDRWFDSGRLGGRRLPESGERRIPRETLVHFMKENGIPLGSLAPPDEAADPADSLAAPLPPAVVQPVDVARVRDGNEQRRQKMERLRGKAVFTLGEVALMVCVSARTVRKWFDAGRLSGHQTGKSGRRQVPREDLVRFLTQHGMPVPEPLLDGDLEQSGGSPRAARAGTTEVLCDPCRLDRQVKQLGG